MAPPITCDCGACQKCVRRVYMRDYYRRNAATVRAAARASRRRRLESVRAYDRERGYREYDPVKAAARRSVNHALARGELMRQPCEVCGTTREVDAHHDDYAKPLDVRWLCRPHHLALHRRVA